MHFFVWRLTTTLNEHQLWDGWAGRFVSAHRPNVSNCLLLLFSSLVEASSRRGEKKKVLCVSCFSFPHWSASAKLNKHKRTYVHTHTDKHTRDPVIKKKKIQFWAPTFRDQKRKEKAAQTTVAVLLLFSSSDLLSLYHHHLLLTGFSAYTTH